MDAIIDAPVPRLHAADGAPIARRTLMEGAPGHDPAGATGQAAGGAGLDARKVSPNAAGASAI